MTDRSRSARTVFAALAFLLAFVGACARDKPTPSAKAFGAFCVDDAECAGGVCFHKRLKTAESGPERRGGGDAVEHDGYCSMRCAADADCPTPPSNGRCGARGMCKRPE